MYTGVGSLCHTRAVHAREHIHTHTRTRFTHEQASRERVGHSGVGGGTRWGAVLRTNGPVRAPRASVIYTHSGVVVAPPRQVLWGSLTWAQTGAGLMRPPRRTQPPAGSLSRHHTVGSLWWRLLPWARGHSVGVVDGVPDAHMGVVVCVEVPLRWGRTGAVGGSVGGPH